MTFLALLVALLTEQLRPLRHANPAHVAFTRFANALEHACNAGQYRQGVLAWMLAAGPAVLGTAAIGYGLRELSPVAGWIWSVAVLYLTMGFRQFSHAYTDIQKALRGGDLDAARARLRDWSGERTADLDAGEIARLAIEHGLAGSHRHVFGPIAWFIVLGPAGAMLYRIAAVLQDKWGTRADADFGEFGRFATRAHIVLEWVPVRLTAASFAVAGSFVDAVDCWRTQARTWSDAARGILLAAGGGALGVRLGDALHRDGQLEYRPELGGSDAADVDHLDSAVGLIWRSLVLWMFLLLLFTVARSLG